MSHTPTPWKESGTGGFQDAKGNHIPIYSGFIAEAYYGEEPAISNAEFVVRAVNAYDAFMRVAWAAKEFVDDWKKGDFDLSTLAALDAESINEALVALSAALAPELNSEGSREGE